MTKPNEQTWVFTFGFGQGHDNCYTLFHGTFSTARAKMVKHFGSKWAFQYASKEKAGVKEYNLKYINRYGTPGVPEKDKK